MKRTVCVLCLLAVVMAAMLVAVPCEAKSVYGVVAQERVIQLPNDQDKWYVSVVGTADNARYLEVVAWFNSHPGLKKLKDSSHFNTVTTNNPMYAARYAKNAPSLPMVRVQDSDGTVIYQASGSRLPMTAGALNASIAAYVEQAKTEGCLRRRCPDQPNPPSPPSPSPSPSPSPLPPEPPAEPVPDTDKPTESGLPPWWMVAVALAIGAGAGVAQKWRETYRASM